MTSHDTIRAALEAASTPWQSIPTSLDDERRVLQEWGGGLARGCSCDYTTMDAADAHLVSHAPEWLAELLAEVERLQRWKAEALTVMDGLQELGAALGLRIGERITGEAALKAVNALNARLLPDPEGGCVCETYSEDRGGGYSEAMVDYDPACPKHSVHVYDPRTGVWEFDATARAEAAEATVQRVRQQCAWNKAARNAILRALDGGEK